jgi:hypothetical protein
MISLGDLPRKITYIRDNYAPCCFLLPRQTFFSRGSLNHPIFAEGT